MNAKKFIQDAFVDVPFPFNGSDNDHRHMVQLLRKAFGEEPYAYPSMEPSHETGDLPFYKWYFDLFLLTPDAIQYVLPRLMVRLLDQYPNEVEYAEEVIDLLDVPSVVSVHRLPPIEGQQEDLVGGTATLQNEFWEFKEQLTSRFNRRQVEAILIWLDIVRRWDELQEAMASIASAVAYWQIVRERM